MAKCVKHLSQKTPFRDGTTADERKSKKRKAMAKARRLRKLKRVSASKIRKEARAKMSTVSADKSEDSLFDKLVKNVISSLRGRLV